MHRNLAKTVSRELLFVSGQIDSSIKLIQDVVDQDFFEQYRRAAGGVMGLLYIKILRDLYEKFPELEPDAFK